MRKLVPIPFIAVIIAMGGRSAAEDQGRVEYNRDIRPILSDTCFRCHGPDSAARKAELRLDLRDAAIESSSIVPGKPEDSEALRRILSTDPEEVMPPPSTHKVITEAQKKVLQQWIAEGAEYQPHWSLISPTRPPVPSVKAGQWPKNPIDNFILAHLEKSGLTPASEADKRTLARRASLDFTGLPPLPEEVERFVQDTSPNAYEAYLDRLLAKDTWGEHRARYWLDYARYADTHGIHFDNYREIWAYRDWVIGAFNRNLPFDQFTIEQLAGDLLANATLDQRVASGFNRCNITTNEGGVIPEEYLVLYTRDRTETTSQVWLGLTANCAVCHDHKYDPLSQREFYQMAAFFNNTTQGAMDGNIKDTPPTMTVPQSTDREQYELVKGQIGENKGKSDEYVGSCRAEFDNWSVEVKPDELRGMAPIQNLGFHASLSDGSETTVRISVGGEEREVAMGGTIAWDAGYALPMAFKSSPENVMVVRDAGDFEKDQAFSCGAWIKLPAEGLSGALVARMDEGSQYRGWDLWLDNGRFSSHIIHRWPDDAIKIIAKQRLQAGVWYHVMAVYDGSGKPEGLKLFINGAAQDTEVAAGNLRNSIKTSVPLKVAQRNASAQVNNVAIQDLRIYREALSPVNVSRLAGATRAAFLVEKGSEKRSSQESDELFAWWLAAINKTYQQFQATLAQLEQTKTAIEARATIAHVMNEKSEPAMAFILARGEYDKRKDQVTPNTPELLPAFPSDLPRNRLGFAQWLLRPEHPLTARVTVNRVWQEIFGAGLVRTSGDFGIMGELPSHPELLDWLAIEFRETGWDVKRLYKMIALSATYQQSAVVTPEKLEKDPSNRLLSRGPRYRMDAEMVRDHALAASGLLIRKIGGPSVKPYQPEGVWEAVAMIGSNTRDYKPDSGENLYRRSMYTFWKRSAPPASMEIFNAPSRETCSVRRERTNTPLQALVTLNDPQFVEAARALAQTTLKEAPPDDEARFDFLGARLIARPFRSEEKDLIRQSLADYVAHYANQPEDATKLITFGESKPDPSMDAPVLAAWTMLINEIMNLDEVLNK